MTAKTAESKAGRPALIGQYDEPQDVRVERLDENKTYGVFIGGFNREGDNAWNAGVLHGEFAAKADADAFADEARANLPKPDAVDA